MTRALSAWLCAGAFAVGSTGSFAQGNIQGGHAKATQCATCHGIDGISKLPEAPNLAGQTEVYLVKSLNDFRSGARQNEMMSIIAKSLSDADIANLAAYYHSLGKQ